VFRGRRATGPGGAPAIHRDRRRGHLPG